MKKIVSALALGAVAASLATADVSVKLNSRTRPAIVNYSKTADGAKTTEYTDLDWEASKDEVTISGSGENAKASLTLGPTNASNSVGVETKYWASVKFGNLNITGGKFESIFTPRYNTTLIEEGLTDDGNVKNYGLSKNLVTGWSLTEAGTATYTKVSALKKVSDDYTADTNSWYDSDGNEIVTSGKISAKGAELGYGTEGDSVYASNSSSFYTLTTSTSDKVSLKKAASNKGFMIDVNNITAVAGTRVLSFVADYTVPDVAGGKLLFKAGLFDSTFKTDDDDADDVKKWSAGYSFDAGLQRDDFTVEGVARLFNEDTYAFGGYFNALKLIPDSKASLGVTYGMIKENEDEGRYKWSGLAVDARFVNNSIDKVQLVFQAKYSYAAFDEDEMTNADGDAAKMHGLDLVGQIGYTLNETIDLGLDAGIYMGDLTNELDAKLGTTYVKVRPAIAFKANKNAKLTTACEVMQVINKGDMEDYGLGSTAVTKITVPVILRVKL